MKFPYLNAKSLALALFALGVLTACGGGGGSPGTSSTTSTSGTNTSGTNTGGNGTSTIPVEVPAGTRMTMSCVDGSTYQCSGENIIRMENGVALTSSGVQAYARSTSDLATPIADTTLATGFAPTSGGVAEVRLDKDANGMVSGPALLLNNLGISWNGRAERPQIVETFGTTQGRVQLDANGALTFGVLPIHTDTSFYNFATLGPAATQANYANNRYFPRADPSRCPDTMTPCPTVEGTGVVNLAGDWRTGGSRPDWAEATRLHSDGDLHAGTDAAGNPLPEGTGPGVPYPGSKGYRSFGNWGFQYSNLGTWFTHDTVLMSEWAATGVEHAQNRRGVVAFGDVTNPANVSTTGTATYSGIVYGWYTPSASTEPTLFYGEATATVNFATRRVIVTIANTVTYDEAANPVPATFTVTTNMGAAGSNVANYLTGPVNGTLQGGLSGRYFGPVVSTGSSGAGPAELGGAFTASNATSGAAVVGGFIARKQ